jgi:transposase
MNNTMQNFELTNEQVRVLRTVHRSTRDKRYAYRINAIILLGTGWTLEQTADALLLDQATLSNYVKTYKAEGVDALLKMDYCGSSPKLTDGQISRLDEHLTKSTYLRVDDIVRYIQDRFDISYTVNGLTALLHRMDYVYKKPKVTPGKLPDRQAQEAFVEQYRQIKRTKGNNDPVYFMDGIHPQHNSIAAYGWIKRGTTKSIPSNTGRQRININGAINIDALEAVTEFGDSVNAQSTIALLRKIEQRHPRAGKIYVFCDNARYYRSRLVRGYLEGSKVEIVFLPAYSPNLNLIERLWKYFRKQILYNRYYEKFCQFMNACREFFDTLKSHRKPLRQLLTENFQIIGA